METETAQEFAATIDPQDKTGLVAVNEKLGNLFEGPKSARKIDKKALKVMAERISSRYVGVCPDCQETWIRGRCENSC